MGWRTRLRVWLAGCFVVAAFVAGLGAETTHAGVAADEYTLRLPSDQRADGFAGSSEDGKPELWVGLIGAATLAVAGLAALRRPRKPGSE